MARKAKGKRGDGRFKKQLTVGVKPDGSKDIKYFYSRISLADAERQKQEYMRAHPYGEAQAEPSEFQNMTLSQWRVKWLASYKSKLDAATVAQYEGVSNSICQYVYNNNKFGDMLMRDFLPVHLADYMISLTGTSESNISVKRMVLKELFSTAQDNGLTSIAQNAKLPHVAGTYNGHRALERSEIDLISRNYRYHRLGLAIMLMMWAGLRRGEALALEWTDIDFQANVIHVRRSLDVKRKRIKVPKTKAGTRDVPIFFTLKRALMIHRQESGLICTTANGELYTESAIDRAMDGFLLCMERVLNGVANPERAQGFRRDVATKRIEEAGGKWQTFSFTPHDLRVTFCTMCYDAGVDVLTTSKWMGHKNVTTTMKIYTKLSNERRAESTDAMEAFSKDYAAGPDLMVISGK